MPVPLSIGDQFTNLQLSFCIEPVMDKVYCQLVLYYPALLRIQVAMVLF